MNVLLIGCGNIGALYDIDNDLVQTHAKALSMQQNVVVTLYDTNQLLVKRVADKYGYEALTGEEDLVMENYQWVVIASATDSHSKWLKKCFEVKTPLVICEKPICMNLTTLAELESLYKKSSTKVMVNYIRRFHPEYHALKESIALKSSKPIHIVVTYQRGLINNFSHAADLLQYFFGNGPFENMQVGHSECDAFATDATTSFSAFYKGISLSAIGLPHVKYAYFTIEIYYESEKISILNSGNQIFTEAAVKLEPPYKAMSVMKEKNALLSNYMLHVYVEANRVYSGEKADNFLEAAETNKNLLELV